MILLDLLFENVTAITMQSNMPVQYNINIGIAGQKIVYIGVDSPTAKRVINGKGKVLMPSLYNCHTHTPMSLLRGYANDMVLEEWLFQHIFPAEKKLTPSMRMTGTLLAIAEMVASGTVAFTDMYSQIDIIAKAVEQAGVKVCLSNGVVVFEPNNYDFHISRAYKETMHILRGYHNAYNGRIKAMAAIHAVYTSSEKVWKQVVDFAHTYKLQMHIHISETKTEHNNCMLLHGMTPTQVLEANQVFDVPTTAAHCCWVTKEDMDILAYRGVSVAHCPVSNLKLASGIAPVKQMLDLGINVTLGSDSMASNNSHDLFEEIKLVSILQKNLTDNPAALPALQVLQMATINGAKAQGREHEGGCISIGYDADLVLLNFDNPRQTPCYSPLTHLVYSVTGSDVVMTLCQGRILYENGDFKTIDIEKVLFNAHKASYVLR